MEDLYIVDFEKLGNVVKLYLGNKKQAEDSWGDDWDDAPYEQNAGTVYDEYVTDTIDIAFGSDYVVLEPINHGYGYTKEDMKKRLVPAIVVMKLPQGAYRWEFDTFDRVVGAADAIKIYFGDSIEEIKDKIINYGGIVLE